MSTYCDFRSLKSILINECYLKRGVIMKCCKPGNCCSKDNLAFLIIIGVIAIVLKIVALIDLFKKRKTFSKKKKTLLTIIILIFPPAPLIYLIIVNLKKGRDLTCESVNLNSEGLL